MKCPSCGCKDTKVVDSRPSRDGHSIRRRRECLKCSHRFTTYEYVERTPPMIRKKDGRREPFDREKLLRAIKIACTKRPVLPEVMEDIVSGVEARMDALEVKEIDSSRIGNLVLDELMKVDEVAYVRFASVYKEFKNIDEFVRLIEDFSSRLTSGKNSTSTT